PGGFPPSVSRDPATGITTLVWDLGTMAAVDVETITVDTGIRYDYFGTDNGGNNRAHDDFLGDLDETSTPVPHKTTLTNDASLDAYYTPTDLYVSLEDSASVGACYVTIEKSANTSIVGYDDEVIFTISMHASEYYEIDAMTLTDTMPDGLVYVEATGSTPEPNDNSYDADTGQTTLTWDSLQVGTLAPGTSKEFSFQAKVKHDWDLNSLQGQPILAGDGMTNVAEAGATWHDQVDLSRSGTDALLCETSASLTTRLPAIEKKVLDPASGAWVDGISATVGDVLTYRVRFNTDDGINPLQEDITLGDATLTDWLPPGVVYIDGSAAVAYADINDFTDPDAGEDPELNVTIPDDVSIGSLTGIEWYLGNVAPDGWWEATFDVTVTDVPIVADGLKTGNHWKLTGSDTEGQLYSDRDINEITFIEPDLSLTKAASAPSPLIPGNTVSYSVTIDNLGLGAAQDVLFTDTLPVGMRSSAPSNIVVKLDGTTLAADTDYTLLPAYAAASGVFTIDFNDETAGVETPVPAGSTLTIDYDTKVDPGLGAGATLTNAAVITGNTQDDGSGRDTTDSDDDTVSLAPVTISKTGPAGPLTVGDIYPYEITVTVPAGMYAYDPEIADTLNADAFWYRNTATLDYVSGPTTPVGFVSTSTPDRELRGNDSQTRLRWYLNDINNSAGVTPFVFTLSFDVQYTGEEYDDVAVEGVTPSRWEFAGTTSRNMTDVAAIGWDTLSTGGSTLSATSDTVTTVFRQPQLTTTKTEFPADGPYAGGDTVTYRSVVSNANNTIDAYDVIWQDTLPTYLTNPQIVSITSHDGTTVLTAPTIAVTSETSTLTVDFLDVSLPMNKSFTIVYTADVDPEVGAGAALTNTADADWSTLPGDVAGERVFNDDPSWESRTEDTDTHTIYTAQAALTKSANVMTATIGDVITYTLKVTVPSETVLFSPYLLDTFAADGVEYVADTAVVTLVSGSPDIAASISEVTTSAAGPGGTVRFGLSGIDNADDGDEDGDVDYVFELTYDVRVTGLTDGGSWKWFLPNAGDVADNTASLHWSDGTNARSLSDDASVSILQPLLSIDKTERSTGPYDGGETVTFETVVTNYGSSPAFDVSWSDDLPEGLDSGVLVSVLHNTDDITDSVVRDFSGDPLLVSGFGVPLDPGDTFTIRFTADVIPGVGSGTTLTDTADVDWTSHSGSVPGERVYDDSADEDPYTADTDTEDISITAVSMSKDLATAQTEYSIGDLVTYRITVPVPTNTTIFNAYVRDVLPPSLEYSHATVDTGFMIDADPTLEGTGLLWSIGNVSNPPTSTVEALVYAYVRDIGYDLVPANGIPAASLVTNSAKLSWDDAEDGTTRTSEDSVDLTIVEPDLTIVKHDDAVSVGPGDTVSYVVDITNEGTGPAYRLLFTDRIPDELFSVGSSPALTGVTVDGMVVDAADYTGDFSVTPIATIDFADDFALAVGETLQITYTTTLNGGVAEALTLTNDARISYSSSDMTGRRDYGPEIASDSVTTLAPELSIDKVVVGDDTPQAGGTVDYSVTVSNTGDAPANSIVVTDTIVSAKMSYVGSSARLNGAATADPVVSSNTLVWDLSSAGALADGDDFVLTYTMRVAADAAVGDVPNTAKTDGLDGGDVLVGEVSDDATVTVTLPGLGVSKQLADGQDTQIQVGENVVFDIVLENTGNTDIDVLPLVDTFDSAYLDFISATITPDSTTPTGTLTWDDLGPLAAGDAATVTVTFEAIGNPADHATINDASVTGAADENGDDVPDISDDEPIDITRPDVNITKSLAADQTPRVIVGNQVTFDITVENTGDTTLTVVPVSDTFLSAYLEYSTASIAPSSVTTAVPDTTVEWSDVTLYSGDLAPGQTYTFSVTLLSTDVPDAVLTNTAEIAGAEDEYGDDPGDTDESEDFDVYDPTEVTVVKSADPAAGTILLPGDLITYTVEFGNATTVTFPSTLVIDELSSAVDYITGSLVMEQAGVETTLTDAPDADAGMYDSATRVIDLDLGDLSPDE
ncbi:MAG: isopeptide-forming domain-containing fimbrial protein, partial [Coriobacteriia bacterium]|nr:isopeptide-forming domain-containing fimbrial protein [Coriobacteriia bacterium]